MWCKWWLLYVVTGFVFVVLFVLFFFFIVYSFVHFFPFFKDSHIISITTAEFRYYVVITILGKTLSYMGLRQWRLINFQWTSEPEAGLWISESDFHCKVFVFCDILHCQIFWPWMSWSISSINLLHRMLQLQSFQPSLQDYCTDI